MNLLERIAQSIENAGNHPFLISTQNTYTYRDLKNTIERVLEQIEQCVAGDRAVLVFSDELLASSAFLACMFHGIVPVILPSNVPSARLEAILKVTDASAVLVENSNSLPPIKTASVIVMMPTPKATLTQLIKTKLTIARRREPLFVGHTNENNLAYLLFTSGTTDEPAGIEITYSALSAQLQTLERLFGFAQEDRIANPTPLAHTDGLVQGLLLAVYSGATLIRQGELSLYALDDWMNKIVVNGATHFITNPTVLRRLVKGTEHSDYFTSPKFKGVISSAATLSAEFWTEFEERFSCDLFNIYGMTETVANATYAGKHPEMGAVGTIGKPIDCQLRLRDVDTGDITDTSVGEIELYGNNICRGYWRDTTRNQERFSSDGWLKTGDLARWRADGSLDFVGRRKTVIMTGGLTLSPDEVDEVMMRHQSVKDAITIALPHEDFEEIAVTACLVDDTADETVLMEYARANLEALKVPKRLVLFDEELPRGLSGKPNLALLREQIITALQKVRSSTAASNITADSDGSSKHQQNELNKTVLQVASRVFNLPEDQLSMDTSAGDLDVWDSFNHLNLIVETEAFFDVSFSTSAVLNIKSLDDLSKAVANAR